MKHARKDYGHIQRLILCLSAVALMGQPVQPQTQPNEFITVDFTHQEAPFGPLHLYAANVCNIGPMNATVQSYRDVWPRAAEKNLQLQTPTAIREVERKLEGGDWPKWILWGLAGGCAIGSGVTHGGVVSLDPTKRIGKAVAYGTASCAVVLPVIAERWTGKPGKEQTKAPEAEMLPPLFILGPGDCRQGLVYAVLPFQLRILDEGNPSAERESK